MCNGPVGTADGILSVFSAVLDLDRLADFGALAAISVLSADLLNSPIVSPRGFSVARGVSGTGGVATSYVVVVVPELVVTVRVTTVRVTVGVNFSDFFFGLAGSGTMMSCVLPAPQLTGLACDGMIPPSTAADTPASSMARPFRCFCIVQTQPRAANLILGAGPPQSKARISHIHNVLEVTAGMANAHGRGQIRLSRQGDFVA